MNSKYFRRRKPFDFDPHPLDVGVPFSKNDTHADVHFLIKVQRLPESQLEDLFLRHFNYYKAEFNDTDGREFFKELWQTVNSELKKERSKSQEKLSATQKRRNDLRIQKFQYFIENILPKYDRWNFTVSLSKKYEIVSEQLLQEVKSKTQIEFQRTQELIDSAFTKLANSSNASTESNINTIKTILENYLDSNKEEQEELKKQFIQKQNLDRLLAQYNTTLKELDEFKEQVKKLKKEKSRLNSLDHHKINILNGDKLNLIALFDEFMKASGGKQFVFCKSEEEVQDFLSQKLGYKEKEGIELPKMDATHGLVLMVSPHTGIHVQMQLCECISSPDNTFYDAEAAKKQAAMFILNPNVIPYDLSCALQDADMLPDACLNSALGEEHGRETMKRNARFFTDYFFEKCREKDC